MYDNVKLTFSCTLCIAGKTSCRRQSYSSFSQNAHHQLHKPPTYPRIRTFAHDVRLERHLGSDPIQNNMFFPIPQRARRPQMCDCRKLELGKGVEPNSDEQERQQRPVPTDGAGSEGRHGPWAFLDVHRLARRVGVWFGISLRSDVGLALLEMVVVCAGDRSG